MIHPPSVHQDPLAPLRAPQPSRCSGLGAQRCPRGAGEALGPSALSSAAVPLWSRNPLNLHNSHAVQRNTTLQGEWDVPGGLGAAELRCSLALSSVFGSPQPRQQTAAVPSGSGPFPGFGVTSAAGPRQPSLRGCWDTAPLPLSSGSCARQGHPNSTNHARNQSCCLFWFFPP